MIEMRIGFYGSGILIVFVAGVPEVNLFTTRKDSHIFLILAVAFFDFGRHPSGNIACFLYYIHVTSLGLVSVLSCESVHESICAGWAQCGVGLKSKGKRGVPRDASPTRAL